MADLTEQDYIRGAQRALDAGDQEAAEIIRQQYIKFKEQQSSSYKAPSFSEIGSGLVEDISGAGRTLA